MCEGSLVGIVFKFSIAKVLMPKGVTVKWPPKYASVSYCYSDMQCKASQTI